MSDIFYYTGLLTWLAILLASWYGIYQLALKPLHKYLIKKAWYFWIVDTISFPVNIFMVKKLNVDNAKLIVKHYKWRNIWTHRILKRKLEKIRYE